MSDDQLTRDVSACEKLIMLIKHLDHQYAQGKEDDRFSQIAWMDIDKLKKECDVLPAEYRDLLAELERKRG